MRLSIAVIVVCALASHSRAQENKPLKVYILAGQSNMTGMVSSSTLEHIKMLPDTAKEFADLFDKDGNPVVLDDVYVSQWKGKDGGTLAPRFGGGKGERFGPEYAFGVYMHKALEEPILIIKDSQGGKDLNYHFRPPHAGAWTPPPGHPDLVKKQPDLVKKQEVKLLQLPVPERLDIPAYHYYGSGKIMAGIGKGFAEAMLELSESKPSQNVAATPSRVSESSN